MVLYTNSPRSVQMPTIQSTNGKRSRDDEGGEPPAKKVDTKTEAAVSAQ